MTSSSLHDLLPVKTHEARTTVAYQLRVTNISQKTNKPYPDASKSVLISNILTLLVTAASGYAVYFSAQSIPKLQKYEQTAEKAAEWSSTAKKQLWDTRYTVGAGFIFSLFSLYNGLSFVLFTSSKLVFRNSAWALVLAAGSYGISLYMRSYWNNKAKIPMLEEYNRAIEDSTQVAKALDVLVLGWLVVAPLKLFGV
ncbi:hypothetical protein HYQ44_003041 [Verticillium longisporum]|nr:hypothetical protein HYQ44_003041 [Verticillium longisporum]